MITLIAIRTQAKERSYDIDKDLSKGSANKVFLGQAGSDSKSISVAGYGNSSSRNTVKAFISSSSQRLDSDSELDQTTTPVDPTKIIPLIQLTNRHN